MKNVWFYDYPTGTLGIAEENGAITHIFFGGDNETDAYAQHETPLIKKAAGQLREYFESRRTVFDLPLAPQGTAFQQEVWQAVQAIPAGATRSYQEIAALIGRPRAFRAMGAANGRNPIPIVIPCHRVIGHDGNLTGYAGGLEMKRYLLDLEKRYA